MRRWWRAVGLAVLAFFAGAGWQERDQGPGWLDRDGADWARFGPDVRQGYLEGFLTGAAVAQAAGRGAADSGSIAQQLQQMKRHGEFIFPYAPGVYGSRVSDHYWWENHRAEPIWLALWQVNLGLKGSTEAGERH